jgi:hypothetical protein
MSVSGGTVRMVSSQPAAAHSATPASLTGPLPVLKLFPQRGDAVCLRVMRALHRKSTGGTHRCGVRRTSPMAGASSPVFVRSFLCSRFRDCPHLLAKLRTGGQAVAAGVTHPRGNRGQFPGVQRQAVSLVELHIARAAVRARSRLGIGRSVNTPAVAQPVVRSHELCEMHRIAQAEAGSKSSLVSAMDKPKRMTRHLTP